MITSPRPATSWGGDEEAEGYSLRAEGILEGTLGGGHPLHGMVQNNLAMLPRRVGRLDEAEPRLRRALANWESTLGPEHPDVSAALFNLVELCVARARVCEILELARRAIAIDDRMIAQISSLASDRQRLAYLDAVRSNTDIVLSLVVAHMRDSPEAVRLAFELVLRRKGLGAEAFGGQREAVLGGRHPELVEPLRELAALRRQIAARTLAGPGAEGLRAHREALARWTEQKDRLEAALARRMPEMGSPARRGSASHEEVAHALPAAALVEFVFFRPLNFGAIPTRGERTWGPARYLAFVPPTRCPKPPPSGHSRAGLLAPRRRLPLVGGASRFSPGQSVAATGRYNGQGFSPGSPLSARWVSVNREG